MTTSNVTKNVLRLAVAVLAVLLAAAFFCAAAAAEIHSHDGITFELWGDSKSLPNTAGNYSLKPNFVSLDNTWTVPPGTTNLCLNGQSIQKYSRNGHIIIVGSGATLNLYDCGNGGSITGNTANGFDGGVYVQGGTFNMYSGSITGNTVIGFGGGVHVAGGTFTMSGGSITGNKANEGGGVYVAGGTFTMSGGSITENKATSTGGGVYVAGGTFTMSGGSIIKNTAESGEGGVCIWDGMFNVSNAPVINDNKETNGHARNVYLKSNLITITSPLTVGADIRIYNPWGGNFAQGTDTYTVTIYDAKFFHPDYEAYQIDVNGIENKLCLITKETTTAVTFKDGGNILEEKTYTTGQEFSLPDAPQKTGDAFLGWKVESTGEYFCLYHQTMGYQYLSPSPYYSLDRKWEFGSIYIPALTLTAVWAGAGPEPIPGPVTYSVLTASADTTMGTVSVTLNAEPKNGFLFKKWVTVGFNPVNAANPKLTFTMPAQEIAAVAIFEKLLLIDDPNGGGSGVNDSDNTVVPDENGKVKIKSETVKENPEVPIVKMMEVNGASSSVSFKGTSAVDSPTETLSGFNTPTVFAKFEITSTDQNIKFVIDVEKQEGINPQYIFLRHFNTTANKWDNSHIAGKQLSEAPDDFFRLEFPIPSCSPFAVVYEIPVSNPQPSHSSSRNYGSSVWLPATTEPTPIAEATPEPTLAQPTASPIKPTPQASTPVPAAGIIAGLGAAAVFGLRRK